MQAKTINHIVVVEDNEASRHLMREAFKSAAFEGDLQIAENGNQLLDALRKEADMPSPTLPDLIMLDLNLPGKTGVEVMEELKNDERFLNIPVVVLTGSNAANDIKACSKFHCKYLLKPSRFHELVQLVKSLPDFI